MRAPDFLDVENHPKITFKGHSTEQVGANHYKVTGELTIRGVTKTTTLEVSYLGQWQTPYWVGNEDKGPITRAGFTAKTTINRQDFGVSWNAAMDKGGVIVGNEVLMVTWVRGHFTDVHGTLEFDPQAPPGSSIEAFGGRTRFVPLDFDLIFAPFGLGEGVRGRSPNSPFAAPASPST